jgi:phosphatidylserine/phosphatidylglycerophosphate/cardiolipin synthase-like enzyme
MHHKVFVIDGKIVALGSYNFSQSAETRNDENLLIVYNEDIAQQYLEEFQRVDAQAHE